MAFLATFSTHERSNDEPWARLTLQPAGKQGDRRRVTFCLSRPLIEQLGWQANDRVVIAVGIGPDLGSFQLTRSTSRAGQKLIRLHQSKPLRVSVTLAPVCHGIRPADILDRLVMPHYLATEIRDTALVLHTDPKAAVETATDRIHLAVAR